MISKLHNVHGMADIISDAVGNAKALRRQKSSEDAYQGYLVD